MLSATGDMSALNAPSWFGKLPGTGDFARRRLDDNFLGSWDQWLQNGLMRLRNLHDDWMTRYLRAPLWYFVLGEHVIDSKPWVGVMMPSVDSVGRYFPLTLVHEIKDASVLRTPEFDLTLASWWSRCAQHAFVALENNLDASRFDDQLLASFTQSPVDVLRAPRVKQFPLGGFSSWYAYHNDLGAVAYTMPGLPEGESFDMLFGCTDISNDSLETLPASLMDHDSLGRAR
jgi:type VI secretion system protein ImpM